MPVDIFRDTWVRYLGYANEVGEAFRCVVPVSVVRFSYKVAFGYVMADTITKGLKQMNKDASPKKVLITASDAFIWQTLASVVIPGFTINRICYYTGKGLTKYVPKMAPNIRSGIIIGVGLASIPIIVHPIDTATTAFMDATYRKIFHA